MRHGEVAVERAGKAYREYGSEWRRVGGWFGLPAAPRAEHWVLRDVSFRVAPGESIAIVGPNGAGKSTLLKLITGTVRPSEGTVRVAGRIAAILELGMGFNPEFTGRENAFRVAGLMGHPRADIAAAMPAIEAFADVGEYFDHPVRTGSSGMQMRIAFAVATAFTPDVLLIDEALAVGDVAFQAKCFARIEAMCRDGASLILVSHSVEDVVKHCDRALLVDGGRMLLDDSSRAVTNAYLDLLWGRGREVVVTGAAPGEAELAPGTEDRFASRPLYRPEEHRFGAGGARIVDYVLRAGEHAFPTPIRAGDALRVAMRVVFDRDVARPVYGMLIKTHDGVFLYGTNSSISAAGASAAAAGEIVDVEFEFTAAMNTGAFLLSLGVSSEETPGELRALDRRYDAILLQVAHELPLWGIVDFDARCHVRHGATHA